MSDDYLDDDVHDWPSVSIDIDTLWCIWNELNAICARDGAPTGVCPDYFNNLKDTVGTLLPEKYRKPWHPKYVRRKEDEA